MVGVLPRGQHCGAATPERLVGLEGIGLGRAKLLLRPSTLTENLPGDRDLPRVVWCGVVWCGVVWCGVVWCGMVWCGVVWCGVVWCGVVWCGVVWCSVAPCNAVRCSVARCGVAWRVLGQRLGNPSKVCWPIRPPTSGRW